MCSRMNWAPCFTSADHFQSYSAFQKYSYLKCFAFCYIATVNLCEFYLDGVYVPQKVVHNCEMEEKYIVFTHLFLAYSCDHPS